MPDRRTASRPGCPSCSLRYCSSQRRRVSLPESPASPTQSPEDRGLRLHARHLQSRRDEGRQARQALDDDHLHAVRARSRQDGRLPQGAGRRVRPPVRQREARLRNRKACTRYRRRRHRHALAAEGGQGRDVLQRADPRPRPAQRQLPRHDRRHRSQRHPQRAQDRHVRRSASPAPAPPTPPPPRPPRAGLTQELRACRRRWPARLPPSRRPRPRRPAPSSAWPTAPTASWRCRRRRPARSRSIRASRPSRRSPVRA